MPGLRLIRLVSCVALAALASGCIGPWALSSPFERSSRAKMPEGDAFAPENVGAPVLLGLEPEGQILDVWRSALQTQCWRLIPDGATETVIVCNERDGWVVMRDLRDSRTP